MFWSHFLNPDKSSAKAGYHRISQKEARQMMEKPGILVVDVREPEEYAQGHIPGAHLLTLDRIDAKSAAAVIPDKETQTLVYCRSGHRSKMAAGMLAELGYTQIYEMGGILSWPYEVEYNQ